MLEKVFTIFFLLVSVALGKTLPDGTVQTHRQKISIDNTKVNATLSNFPALVTEANLNSTFLSECQSDGDDIRFTSDEAGDTQLAQDIEQYTTDGAAVNVWVKIASVSSSVDTDIWAWCGDASATAPTRSSTYGAENVWDANYKGVWHLHEGDNTAIDFYKDMTSNLNHGTLTDANGNSVSTTGQVDGAFDLNGDADYIDLGSDSSIDMNGNTTFSISFWYSIVSSQSDKAIVLKGKGCAEWSQYSLSIGDAESSGGADNDKMQFFFRTGDNSSKQSVSDVVVAPTGVLTYMAGTLNGTTLTLYRNGVSVNTATSSGSPWASTEVLSFGADPGCGIRGEFDGILDEVRISNVTRSADWIKTEYNNQNSPSTFWTAGATENLIASSTSRRRVIN